MKTIVSIVVPVYGDWESLKESIKALKKMLGRFSQHKVLLVNDCGPDADVIEKSILKAIRGRRNFYYYRNDWNVGFVKSCNNAVFNLTDHNTDIMLLNSDAVVTKGSLNELQQVLYSEDSIGAVCPRSNAATIFSVPMNNTNYDMKGSYKLYKKIKSNLPDYYISPVAHGFCMMIRREVINKYGLFDEVYGKGYGEENDFCMRIRSSNWRCAVANKAYVFHYKARSFTEEKRKVLVQSNEKILHSRYPQYTSLVNDYIAKHQSIEGTMY